MHMLARKGDPERCQLSSWQLLELGFRGTCLSAERMATRQRIAPGTIDGQGKVMPGELKRS